MLTREEQEAILKMARSIIVKEKNRDTRVKKHLMSERSARELSQRDWDDFADLLKEVG